MNIITLFRFITVFCGIDNTPQNNAKYFHIQHERDGIFCGQNIVIDLNNVMMMQALLIKEVYTKSSSRFQGPNRIKLHPYSQVSLCFHVVATSSDS